MYINPYSLEPLNLTNEANKDKYSGVAYQQ
jgi:hypothetical protein